jgi:hypothetical protein
LIQEQRDLHTFNDPEVAFGTGAERLKRILVSFAFVSRQRNVIAVKLHNDRPLLQSSFVGFNVAGGHSQEARAE